MLVRQGSEPGAVYWLMNGLASVIAGYALLDDSGPWVIGAMVVAMLLGPISGVALGLEERDRRPPMSAPRTVIGDCASALTGDVECAGAGYYIVA